MQFAQYNFLLGSRTHHPALSCVCVCGILCKYIYSCSDLLHFDLHAYGSLPACLKQNDDASCTELYLRFFRLLLASFFRFVDGFVMLLLAFRISCGAFPFKRCHCIRCTTKYPFHFALCFVRTLFMLSEERLPLLLLFLLLHALYLCDKYFLK